MLVVIALFALTGCANSSLPISTPDPSSTAETPSQKRSDKLILLVRSMLPVLLPLSCKRLRQPIGELFYELHLKLNPKIYIYGRAI